MRNLKIKPKMISDKVTIYHFLPSHLDLSNNRTVVYEGFSQEHRTLENFSSKLSKTYVSFLGNGEFDNWCECVNSIQFDFRGEGKDSISSTLDLCDNGRFGPWKSVLTNFAGAVKEYTEQKNELKESYHSDISEDSAKWFFLLAPLLAVHKLHIYIDSSNGCINVDLSTRDNGILTTHISQNGHIHYSYVARNNKIFKITGTAKFKESKDFIKFNKVLQML